MSFAAVFLLAADAVVCGSLVYLGDGKLEVNARLIRVADGLVLTTAVAEIREDWKETSAVSGTGSAQRLDLSMISVPRQLFAARCFRCHGEDGEAPGARDLTSASAGRKSEDELREHIEAGGEAMPPQGEAAGAAAPLTEVEIDSLAHLVHGLGRDRQARDGQARAGARLFDRHCAACHGYDGRGSHLAAGLFEVAPEALDLTRTAAALNNAQLADVLRAKKRRMLLRADMSPDALTQLWLYLRKLSKG